jgi:CheY-like chemotaxis protein
MFVPSWAVPPRVLLVDDDDVNRWMSSKVVQAFGCTIDVAVDEVGLKSVFEVKSTNGDIYLGGEGFDVVLVNPALHLRSFYKLILIVCERELCNAMYVKERKGMIIKSIVGY